MTIELWLSNGSYKESFQANVEFTPGKRYSFNNSVTQYYQLDLALEILSRIDVANKGGEYIRGWENPFKIYCYNTNALKISRIETAGTKKTTVIDPVPGVTEGQVFETETGAILQMPANGKIEASTSGKGDYYRYTDEFYPEYAAAAQVRVEYEITKIRIYAEEFFYRLSFDMNGGAGSVSSRNLKPGRVISSPLFTFNRPTRSGFSLLGWSQTATDVKPQYPLLYGERFIGTPSFPGEKSFTMPNHDCTLYAIWHQWTYRPLTQNGVIIHERDNGIILRDGDG